MRMPRGLRAAGVIALGATLARMPLAAHLELSPDEAYYWLWSKRLAMSYFDHPPMVAWMIALSTKLFGNGELAVRLPALLCGATVIFALAVTAWLLAPPEKRDGAASATALIAAVMPLTHAGSILVSPDSPAAAFWAVALAALAAAVRGRESAWYLAGAALGLALLSKYNAVCLGASMALLAVYDRDTRAQLKGPGPWLAALLSIALFMPVILWNRAHGWASFLFQLHHGTGGHGGISTGMDFLGSQIGILTPTLAGIVGIALVKQGETETRQGHRLLAFAFAPTLALFTLLSFKSKPEANWAAFAYLACAPLAGLALVSYQGAAGRWTRGLYVATIALVSFASVLVSVHAVHPLVTLKVDRLRNEFHGWRARAAAARAAAGPQGILLGDSYRVAAELAYYGGRVDGVGVARLPVERVSMFDVWEGPVLRPGADAVYVSWYERKVPDAWAGAFREVEPLSPPPDVPATIVKLSGLRAMPPTRPGTLAQRSGARGLLP